MINADEERAVTYLERLSRALLPTDSFVGLKYRLIADSAVAWKDSLVESGAITSDLQDEFAARRLLGGLEVEHSRNQGISDREVRQKAKRTPSEQDSVRKEICALFGIRNATCPPE